jgi:hypothetical protein
LRACETVGSCLKLKASHLVGVELKKQRHKLNNKESYVLLAGDYRRADCVEKIFQLVPDVGVVLANPPVVSNPLIPVE